tara:strand:+ start:243 stop:875 length:633 start_codon:yes stop_codon:yes gene_type:complete
MNKYDSGNTVKDILKCIIDNKRNIVIIMLSSMLLYLTISIFLPKVYEVKKTFLIKEVNVGSSYVINQSYSINDLNKNIKHVINSRLFYMDIANSLSSYYKHLTSKEIIDYLRLTTKLTVIVPTNASGLYTIKYIHENNKECQTVVDQVFESLKTIIYEKEMVYERNSFVILDDSILPTQIMYPKTMQSTILIGIIFGILSVLFYIVKNLI